MSKTDKSLLLSTSQPNTRRRLYKVIRTLPEGVYAVNFTKKRNPVSCGQRGYYWGYVVYEAGKLMGYDRETVDRVLCGRFLSMTVEVAGETITIARSLADLNPAESSDYFMAIRMWIWDKYRVRLTTPDVRLRKSNQTTLVDV